jgi:hypothetical protein
MSCCCFIQLLTCVLTCVLAQHFNAAAVPVDSVVGGCLTVEVPPDELGVDLEPQVAGERNGEQEPEPAKLNLLWFNAGIIA